jgi:hypothetical protein
VPSNIPEFGREDILLEGLSELDLSGAQSPVKINSDDGSIVDASGSYLRMAGTGLLGGLMFYPFGQTGDESEPAGIFTLRRLHVPVGITLQGVGSVPIILYVTEDVTVAGTIDLGAMPDKQSIRSSGEHIAGPGGSPGGADGDPGQGPSPGLGGEGEACGCYTTSGGGGGGFASAGGTGGDGADPFEGCDTVYDGGVGGGSWGNVMLQPLTGGSGGGAGGVAVGGDSEPGRGGAGGGALQITALQEIVVESTGVITAPGGGGGGGDLEGGGGGGGGAGGAILLESQTVILEPGSVVAANGGGGGSGDHAS